MRRSADPVRALAVIWACKEAAHKLFSKPLAQSHFVPKKYVVQFEDCDLSRIRTKLSILNAGSQTEVSIFQEERWVHAIAHFPPMNFHWVVREIEKCFLGGRRARSESEAVRSLASALLEELAVSDVDLQFEGRVPRLRHKSGQDTGMHVSLSHHGAFAAVAIAWPVTPPLSHFEDALGFAETKNSEAACFTCAA